ncbi:protein-tyrosine phosphatase-like protein, partial [Chytridium lagenaria]
SNPSPSQHHIQTPSPSFHPLLSSPIHSHILVLLLLLLLPLLKPSPTPASQPLLLHRPNIQPHPRLPHVRRWSKTRRPNRLPPLHFHRHPHPPRMARPSRLKGSLQAPMYLEKLFSFIEDTESDRHSGSRSTAHCPPFTDNPFSQRISSERGNLRRNRYTDIVPYDRFRVPLLHPTPVMIGGGIPATPPRFSDYINASFLDTTPLSPSMAVGKRYISTQGPLPETVRDFWGMVWDQQVTVIVMLTKEEERGRPKCHRYWPEEGMSSRVEYGDGSVEVEVVGRQSVCGGEVVVREMKVGRVVDMEDADVRTVWHVHYLNWPDHKSSTAKTVLEVIDLANRLQGMTPFSGPMVVHCSAGCGRTGTFCVIDTVLHQLSSSIPTHSLPPLDGTAPPQDPEEVDDLVLAAVMRMRERRVAMVQTLEQFAFCYEAVVTRLLEWVLEGREVTWVKVGEQSLCVKVKGGPVLAGPRSAGGWGRSGAGLGGGTGGGTGGAGLGGLEVVVEGDGSPVTPLVPPTPGPSGIAFDWDAALKKAGAA